MQGHAQSESQSDLADLGAGIQSIEALEIKYEADNLEKLVEETAVGPVSGVDERVGTFAFSSADYEVNESGEAVSQIKITREEGNLGVVDLLVTPQALTASSDEDFISAPIALRFEDQEITKTLSLVGVLIDDQVSDAGEPDGVLDGGGVGGNSFAEQWANPLGTARRHRILGQTASVEPCGKQATRGWERS